MPKKITRTNLSEFMEEFYEKNSLDLRVSMPGRVETYDNVTQKASIQPLFSVRYKMAPDKIFDLPVINDVPVQWHSASIGLAYMHLPLKPGDLGMLIFADRSLDKYLSSIVNENNLITPANPNKIRHHDLADGWFIPGVLPFNVALPDTDPNDLVIRNNKMRVELGDDGTIAFRNRENELIDILMAILTYIRDGRVLTALGPSGWIAADYDKIESMLVLLNTFKRD